MAAQTVSDLEGCGNISNQRTDSSPSSESAEGCQWLADQEHGICPEQAPL